MVRAIYPGSFDPATFGHLDVIKRAAELFDEVIVGVLMNSEKSPLFSVEERVNILKKVTADIPNLKVTSFSGLSVNFARSCDAKVIIRGLRAITDFEYELQMAQTNRVLAKDVDTMFLTTQPGVRLPEFHHCKRSRLFSVRIFPSLFRNMSLKKVKEKYAQKEKK